MKNKNSATVGLIAARKNSKGVKNKNLLKLRNKPITKLAIDLAIEIPKINYIILSSDDDKILSLKNSNKIFKIKRDKRLCKDNTPMMPVIQNALKLFENKFKIKIDKLVLFDPTAPLRNKNDINNSIKLFDEKKPDLLISAHDASHNPYFSMLEKKGKYFRLAKKLGSPPGSRQLAPKVFEINTLVWIYSRKAITEIKQRIPKKTIIFKTNIERSIDIDNNSDINRIKYYLKK